MERAKGFEPSTSTLARLRSTPELHPHSVSTPSDYNEVKSDCKTFFKKKQLFFIFWEIPPF